MTPTLLALALLVGVAPSQGSLDAEVNRFAQAWAQKDLHALTALMTSRGIRLDLPGEEHPLIQLRQAQAALKAFMERYTPGQVEPTVVSLAGDDPRKGYSEIHWLTRAQGVPEPLTITLFVAFSLEDASWKVTEIRVLL